MPKQRTERNRIGRRGEAAFQAFAVRRHLLPTKPEEDVGFDFLCEIEETSGGPSRAIRGEVLGVSVRSTSLRGRRVRVDRDDAERMLAARFPVCLVLVAVRPKTEVVHYRFLDSSFSLELAGFLSSDRRTFSLTPERCRAESSFEVDLNSILDGHVPERNRLAIAQSHLHVHLPNSAVEVRRTAEGELTLVVVENFYDLFVRSKIPIADDVYAAVFGSPRLRVERLAEIGPRPEVLAALSGLPAPQFQGTVTEAAFDLVVENASGSATLSLVRHETATHFGWVFDAGFSITISTPVEERNAWVHMIEAVIDPDEELDLAEHPDLWEFLERCTPDATLRPASQSALELEASYVHHLERCRFYASCLRRAVDHTGWSEVRTFLRDALADESLNTMAWLTELSHHPQAIERFGYVLGDAPLEEFDEQDQRAELAVVGNLGSQGVVTWIDADVAWLAHDGLIRGLRVEQVNGIRIETTNRLDKSSTWPEMVVDETWPTIAFELKGPSQTSSDAREWGLGARDVL